MEKTIYTVIISNNLGDIIKVSNWASKDDAVNALYNAYDDTIDEFNEFSDGDNFDIADELTTEITPKNYRITYNGNSEFGVIEQTTLTY